MCCKLDHLFFLDSFNERPSLVDEDLSGLNGTDGLAERAKDRGVQGRQQETPNGDYGSSEDEDSFTEVPFTIAYTNVPKLRFHDTDEEHDLDNP